MAPEFSRIPLRATPAGRTAPMQLRSIAHKLRRFRRALWRRWRPACAAASAAFYLVLVLGVPLPLPGQMAAKDTSEPFPCMDCACGCRNAEQCWRHCCCHTLAQRLAWAREHNVRPPEYVLAQAKAEGIDWEAVGNESCSAKSGEKCCCCCQHGIVASPQPSHSGKGGDQSPPRQSSGAVVLIQALGCRGIGLNSTAGAISLPPPRPTTWSFCWTVTGEVSMHSMHSSEVEPSVPVPPPRRAAI